MDPNSVATESATLLAFTTLVSALLYGPWKTPTSVVGPLLDEVLQLRRALESIEQYAAEVNGPIGLPPLPAIYARCKDLLIDIWSKLSDNTTSAFEQNDWKWRTCDPSYEGRAWPLDKYYTLEAIQDLRLFRMRMYSCLRSLSAVESRPLDLAESWHSTEQQIPRSDWLWRTTAEYSSIHASKQSQRVQGTGQWFLDESLFKRWLRSDRADDVLCCFGSPGSGKSILTSLVIDETVKLVKTNTGRELGIAYFYFNYRTPLPMESVALTLLQQLYLQAPNAANEIKQLAERRGKLQSATQHEILPALLLVAGMFQRTYIILDALDECALEHQQDLHGLLQTIKGSQCRLFVTGRPSQAISIFKDEPSIPIRAKKEDITLLVHAILRDVQYITTDMRHDIAQKIAAGADGMFLLPALQLQKLLQDRNMTDMQTSLSKLPGSLYSVYDDQIERISAHELKDMAYSAISCLYYAMRPLTMLELQGALLAIDPRKSSNVDLVRDTYDMAAILNTCMGLVAESSNTSMVSFVHYSVHEYLTSRKQAAQAPPGQETSIGTSCLNLLLREQFRRCPQTLQELKMQFELNPFYAYAASFWGHHARMTLKVESDTDLRETILRLLNDEELIESVTQAMLHGLASTWSTSETFPMQFSSAHVAAFFGLEWAFSKLTAKNVKSKDTWGKTPLHVAAEFGFPTCIQPLLELGIEVNSTDLSGKTAMHYAALNGYTEVAEAFSLHGEVDISVEDRSGQTALAYAASSGHTNFIKNMIGHTMLQPTAWHSLLHVAIISAQSKVVGLLLEHGVDFTHTDLIDAIKSGVEESVEKLIEWGANIEPQTEDEVPPLHAAVSAGQYTIVKLLVENGAHVEVKDSTKRTALSHAVEREDFTLVKYLLEVGAKADVLINSDETALVYSTTRGMERMVGLLAPVCPLDAAVGAAAANGHEKVVRLLLDAGAPFDQKNVKGETPLQLASANGHASVVDLLESAGANTNVLSKDNNIASVTSAKEMPAEYIEETSSAISQPENDSDGRPSVSRDDGQSLRIRESRNSQDTGIHRSTTSPTGFGSGRPTWLLMEYAIPYDHMRKMLGAIVGDFRRPFYSYAPKDLGTLQDVIAKAGNPKISTEREFKMEKSTSKQRTSLRELLFTSPGSKQQESHMALNADVVTTHVLYDHQQAFEAVLKNFKDDVWRQCGAGKTGSERAYMVVGFQTWKDARILRSMRESNNQSISVGVPTSSVMTALGAVADMGPSISWSKSNERASHSSTAFEGEGVFAVQYRTVRLDKHMFKKSVMRLGDFPKLSASEALF